MQLTHERARIKLVCILSASEQEENEVKPSEISNFNERKQRNACIFFVERGRNSTKLNLFEYLLFPLASELRFRGAAERKNKARKEISPAAIHQ